MQNCTWYQNLTTFTSINTVFYHHKNFKLMQNCTQYQKPYNLIYTVTRTHINKIFIIRQIKYTNIQHQHTPLKKSLYESKTATKIKAKGVIPKGRDNQYQIEDQFSGYSSYLCGIDIFIPAWRWGNGAFVFNLISNNSTSSLITTLWEKKWYMSTLVGGSICMSLQYYRGSWVNITYK